MLGGGKKANFQHTSHDNSVISIQTQANNLAGSEYSAGRSSSIGQDSLYDRPDVNVNDRPDDATYHAAWKRESTEEPLSEADGGVRNR